MASYIKVIGGKQFKELCAQINKSLEARIMRQIARKGGRVVVKKVRVEIPGELGKQIKKDVGVVNDRRNKSAVKVTLRSKYFTDKSGKQRIVSSIARHMTEGSKQNERYTKAGKKKRGRVSRRYKDFIHEAGENNRSEVMNVMAKESKKIIETTIQKHRRKR
jgi:hypothetical protein